MSLSLRDAALELLHDAVDMASLLRERLPGARRLDFGAA